MPTSINSPDVQSVFDTIKTPSLKSIQVGDSLIDILTPFPSPEDWRDIVIYFLLVDRFNNPKAAPRHLPWNSVYDEFQGGTFNGIRQQLDYLQELGIRALWLSPVLKNCQYSSGTYHGYGIQDFLSIDPRYASDPAAAQNDPQLVERELRELIDEAHARGIYIIFDIVLHHVGDVFAYKDYGELAPWSDQPYTIYWRDAQGSAQSTWTEIPPNPPSDAAVWPKELQSNIDFRRKGNAFAPGGQPGGDFFSLRALVTDFDNGDDPAGHAVINTLIRSYQYIIAKYDVDGFRIDTLKYLSPDFARIFANGIREFALSIGKKNFFTFGEVYDSEEEIALFIGRNTTTTEAGDIIGVDAALDFPLFYDLPAMCKGFLPPSDVVAMYAHRKQVERDILSTHGDASNFFVTFLDNHDQPARFFYRDPTNPDRFDDQLTLGVGCLLSLPGIPCLYYGTEQGLSGSGDRPEAVREALWGKPDAFDPDSVLYSHIAQVAALRNNNPTLRYGRFYFRPNSTDGTHFAIDTTAPGVLALSRILNDQEVVIVANTSTQTNWAGQVIVDLQLNDKNKPYSILFSNKTGPTAPGPVTEKPAGTVQVTEVDGSTTQGPIRALSVNLQPMEIQILGR